MEQAFETSVAESLENNFGTLAEKESFPQAVLSAGENLIADNIADYLIEIVNIQMLSELIGAMDVTGNDVEISDATLRNILDNFPETIS